MNVFIFEFQVLPLCPVTCRCYVHHGSRVLKGKAFRLFVPFRSGRCWSPTIAFQLMRLSQPVLSTAAAYHYRISSLSI